MRRFSSWCLAAVFFGLVGDCPGEIPTGVFCFDGEEGRGSPRIELTGGTKAYWQGGWRDLRTASVTELPDGEGLRLVIGSDGKERELTLTRSGNAWVDQDGQRWVPRKTLLVDQPSWTPVRIVLNDPDGKAFAECHYEYWIEWAGGSWDPLLVRPLRRLEGGVIEFKAPAACLIHLTVVHPDVPQGYGTGIDLERKGGAAKLERTVPVGQGVQGTVRVEATGEPLAGAVVSPLIFTPPSFSEDYDRAVTTGADGSFELRGLDIGYAVEHRDYLPEQAFLDRDDGKEPVKIRLKEGETIHGVVRDAQGHPLAGVEVDDGSGKTATTGDDGSFVLRGLRKWSDDKWWLDFEKEGFNDLNVRRKEIPEKGLVVTLEALPELKGQVFGPDGKPVRHFRLTCGPGSSPYGFECVTREVKDEEGRFALRPDSLPDEGEQEYWMGVRAKGAAVWERVVPVTELESGTLRIVLEPGVAMTATPRLPEGARGPIEVELRPADRVATHEFIGGIKHPGEELATSRLRIERGKPLRLPHLRKGEFELRLSAEKATPVVRPVTVGELDLDLGEVALAGTGTIVGMVKEPPLRELPWRFADGEIAVPGFSSSAHLRFKTDEQGRFRVEGVPSGEVEVSFLYQLSADIFDAISTKVTVREGEVSEVRFPGREERE